MTDELRKLKDEFVAILNTRIGWFTLGIVIGSGGNAKSAFDVVRTLLGV